jgi:S-adenosylmethionine:tRNA ribosyltransferase-isomerase
MHSLDDYDYILPEHLIAQTLASPPESCRLLGYDKSTKRIDHHIFSDITDLIDDDTLMIFNNTKVVHARLVFSEYISTLAKDPEIFYLSSINSYTFHAFVAPGKKFLI